jgi:hypothetical protein
VERVRWFSGAQYTVFSKFLQVSGGKFSNTVMLFSGHSTITRKKCLEKLAARWSISFWLVFLRQVQKKRFLSANADLVCNKNLANELCNCQQKISQNYPIAKFLYLFSFVSGTYRCTSEVCVQLLYKGPSKTLSTDSNSYKIHIVKIKMKLSIQT